MLKGVERSREYHDDFRDVKRLLLLSVFNKFIAVILPYLDRYSSTLKALTSGSSEDSDLTTLNV